MRHLAIGDIHGCLTALNTLDRIVPFRDDDVLIFLGDYVDRGPDSKGVIDWIIDRQKKQQVVALRGNHEIMMNDARMNIDAFQFWKSVGGDATLDSYSKNGEIGILDDVPDEHWQFINETCVPSYEIDTHFFVHAFAEPELALEDQREDVLYWCRFDHPWPHRSGKTMVCGHTAQQSGWPDIHDCAVCIDTWCYGSGWLSCLDVATGDLWQARQNGETRRGNLSEPPPRP